MIFAIAAAVAAAAPASTGCPDIVTPEAMVCRSARSRESGQSRSRGAGVRGSGQGLAQRPAGHRAAVGRGRQSAGSTRSSRARRLSRSTGRWPGPDSQAEQRGEALLDRARAAEAQNDLKTARAKLNEAVTTIAEDPFYWYFSAALAIREGDRATAQSAIGKALTLAPNDPTILFEAGHVAHFLGDDAKARGYWMRAAGSDPNGQVGKAAAKAAEMLGVTADREVGSAVATSRDHSRSSSPPAPSGTARCRPTNRSPRSFAIAGADREIALAGGLDPADFGAAVAGELLGAAAGILVGLRDHLGFEVIEAREDEVHVGAVDRDALADQLGLPRIGASRPSSRRGCAAGSSG